MTDQDIQIIIDRAVKIATRAALNNKPVARILWVPPTSATQDIYGCFAVKQFEGYSSSETPPWEK